MMENDGDGFSNVGDDVWVVGVNSHMIRDNWVVSDVHVDNDIRKQCERQECDESEISNHRTLHPREQNLNGSNKLLPQISQMWATPLPDFGWGLSFRNNTLALFIT